MRNAVIYTDGACKPNPGKGGWAAVIFAYDRRHEIYGRKSNTTNNQMEMIAAINALSYLKEPHDIKLRTDSKYLKKGVTQWVSAWESNNWITSNETPVKNKELWQELIRLSRFHRITWQWVKGHSGREENERADELAVMAREGEIGNLYLYRISTEKFTFAIEVQDDRVLRAAPCAKCKSGDEIRTVLNRWENADIQVKRIRN